MIISFECSRSQHCAPYHRHDHDDSWLAESLSYVTSNNCIIRNDFSYRLQSTNFLVVFFFFSNLLLSLPRQSICITHLQSDAFWCVFLFFIFFSLDTNFTQKLLLSEKRSTVRIVLSQRKHIISFVFIFTNSTIFIRSYVDSMTQWLKCETISNIEWIFPTTWLALELFLIFIFMAN